MPFNNIQPYFISEHGSLTRGPTCCSMRPAAIIVSYVYAIKSHNNSDGWIYHSLLFLYVRAPNQPTIMDVAACRIRLNNQVLEYLMDMPLCITMLFIHSLVFSLEGRAWQEPEPSHVTGMALAYWILGKFLGVVCHCFPPPLDVSTLAARCLRPQRRERS